MERTIGGTLDRTVCLEGLDGAGKSTVARLVAGLLDVGGLSAHVFHDPDETEPLGSVMKAAWSRRSNYSDQQLNSMFAASSKEAWGKACRHRGSSEIHIADRSPLSTYAYLPRIAMTEFLEAHKDFRWPAILFFLNIDPELAALRVAGRNESSDECARIIREGALITERYNAAFDTLRRLGVRVDTINVYPTIPASFVASQIATTILESGMLPNGSDE